MEERAFDVSFEGHRRQFGEGISEDKIGMRKGMEAREWVWPFQPECEFHIKVVENEVWECLLELIFRQ